MEYNKENEPPKASASQLEAPVAQAAADNWVQFQVQIPAQPAPTIPANTIVPTNYPVLTNSPITPDSAIATTAETPSTIPAVKVYRQRVHAKNSTAKHTPIAPRGTIILARDNPGIDKSPFKKGNSEPEKLKLTLVDTHGNIHKRFFADKDAMDWEDPKHISEANKWRNQVLRRIFKKDSTVKGRDVRAKWSMRESLSLRVAVKKQVNAVGGRRLTGEEWTAIRDAHNEQYRGKTVFKGERLIGGQLAKTEETIANRSVVAIKALFDRNAELKAFLTELVGDVVESEEVAGVAGVEAEVKGEEALSCEEIEDEDEDETEVDDESPAKKRKGEHGGVIDHKLEHSSDDEDEGQRPASNPVGGILVAAF